MLVLILFLVLGSLLAYLSKYNLTPVSVNVGTHIFTDIPLFYVIIASLLTGLILSYVIYFFHSISTALILRGKKKEIKKHKDEVLELTKRVHQLELENEKLKHSPVAQAEDGNAL